LPKLGDREEELAGTLNRRSRRRRRAYLADAAWRERETRAHGHGAAGTWEPMQGAGHWPMGASAGRRRLNASSVSYY